MEETCTHCNSDPASDHPDEHPGLCCDCFDLSLGKSLRAVNERRELQGKPPSPPWVLKCQRCGKPREGWQVYCGAACSVRAEAGE